MTDPFVRSALLGTAGSPAAPTGTPVDPLVDQVPEEKRFLLAAGAWAVYLRAGREPGRSSGLPEPAPEETRPVCPPAVAAVLRDLLAGEHSILLDEACSRMAAAGLRLPHELLPAALAVSSYQSAVRQVLGERGRWLSRFNPGWTWARERDPEEGPPADAEEVWEEGSLGERLAILRRVRAVDPALARGWLAPVLPTEKAEPRARLISTLEVGLGPDDEELLEKALDDRSSQVRAAAGLLLARLPGSAYAQRMRDRAGAMLAVEERKLGGAWARVTSLLGGSGFELRIEPPEEVDRSWERDGLPANPPQGTGKRAFWLTEALSRLPPAHWVERFGHGPAEILAAARSSDWAGAAVEGWARATIHFRDADWAPALWDLGHAKAAPAELKELLPQLLAAMSPAEREARVETILSDPPGATPLQVYLGQLSAPWSPRFANRYLEEARRVTADVIRGRQSFNPWLSTLPVAALALPPESFAAALSSWSQDETELTTWQQSACEIVRIRQTLYKEILP